MEKSKKKKGIDFSKKSSKKERKKIIKGRETEKRKKMFVRI